MLPLPLSGKTTLHKRNNNFETSEILRCLLASEGEGGAAVLVRSEMAGGKLVIGQEGGSASMIMEKVLLPRLSASLT